VNRQHFRELALVRLKDAEILLGARQYDSAYYVSGYVIECALKACIARKTRSGDFPDKKRVNDSWTHSPKALLVVSKLDEQLKAARALDPQLDVNWALVAAWSEESRYDRPRKRGARKRAEDTYTAIVDKQHGVLAWLKRRW
jgi:HEPN domain-containing protein